MIFKTNNRLTVLAAVLFLVSCGQSKVADKDSCCQKKDKMESVTGLKLPSNQNNSLYQLTGDWKNQNNQTVALSDLKGKPQLVAMIFTHCGYACPKMVANMKAIETALPQKLKNDVGYLLVSFDTKRDNPTVLKKYAEEHQLDNHWTLLHGSNQQVRTLSMLLQLKYSRLPDGNFDHSNLLTVLDAQGNIVQQFKGLDINTDAVLKAIEQAGQAS